MHLSEKKCNCKLFYTLTCWGFAWYSIAFTFPLQRGRGGRLQQGHLCQNAQPCLCHPLTVIFILFHLLLSASSFLCIVEIIVTPTSNNYRNRWVNTWTYVINTKKFLPFILFYDLRDRGVESIQKKRKLRHKKYNNFPMNVQQVQIHS